MKRKSIGIVAGCLVVTAVMGAGTINAQSSKTESLFVNIPSAGIASALENYDFGNEEKTAEITALITNTVALAPQETEGQSEETTQDATEETTQEATEETTEEVKEKSMYDSIAMSRVEDYVNVRAEANTESEIVGKIYNNCAATILAVEGDWYKMESGNCTGYIKSEYFVTGEEAEAIAIQCGYVNATVTTETLNVREGQGTDSRLLTQLPEGGVFDVIEYGDGWVYLNVDEDIQGWVSMDYVDISVKFDTAITLEEERAKIEEEERLAREAAEAEAAARAAAEAEAARAAARQQAAREQAAAEQQVAEEYISNNYDTSSAAATRQAVVAYAMQFVGNPYVYGGSSLTNGTDCSGFTMSVYDYFGYSLPHSSASQSGCGTQVSTSDLLPGDLLFYTNGGSGIGHVAMYIGNGQVVHASTPATGIKVSNAYYRSPECAVRIIQ